MGFTTLQAYTDAPLVDIYGPVSISKEPRTGALGSLTVAGIINASGGLAVSGSLTGVSLTAVSALTASTGISITAGGETITAGGLSITAGGATVTGGAIVDVLSGGETASGTVQTLAVTGSTILSNARIAKVVGPGGTGTVTSAIIATTGIAAGQELIVINENAAAGSTVTINTGVIVSSGATSVAVSGLGAVRFIFDNNQTKWVQV